MFNQFKWAVSCVCYMLVSVPWCLLISFHTGPSLPLALPPFSSTAVLLEANPADKNKQQNTASFTAYVFFSGIYAFFKHCHKFISSEEVLF